MYVHCVRSVCLRVWSPSRYVQLATLGVLQIEGALTSDQGQYRCEVANEARTRRSNDATLVVNTATTDTGQLVEAVKTHWFHIFNRDLRSFEIRFDFESDFRFGIRFVVMIRLEIFESSAPSIVLCTETIGGG